MLTAEVISIKTIRSVIALQWMTAGSDRHSPKVSEKHLASETANANFYRYTYTALMKFIILGF